MFGGSSHFSKINFYGSIVFTKFGLGGPDLGVQIWHDRTSLVKFVE